MRFSDVLSQALARPVLGLTVLLVLAVILVNGWTDAPNAIATVVTTELQHRRLKAQTVKQK